MDQNQAAQAAHKGMGTGIAHRAFGRHARQALRAAQKETRRLERLLSRYRAGSEISKINRAAGCRQVKISPEVFYMLSRAAGLSAASRGSFDITIGPLVDLWDYKHATQVPPESSVRQILSLVGYTDLILDEPRKTAGLKKVGQSIDLGGVGKGYASDRFVEIFREHGIVSAFTNIGGNVSTLGTKPDGSPWRVGIRHPRQEDILLGAIAVTGKSVVTSGDYERYFVDLDGKRHHHILDPATGHPAESGLISVTVVADSAMTADALSTAIFVAGMEKGLHFLEAFAGAEAVLVTADLTVFITRGLETHFQAAAGIKATILS